MAEPPVDPTAPLDGLVARTGVEDELARLGETVRGLAGPGAELVVTAARPDLDAIGWAEGLAAPGLRVVPPSGEAPPPPAVALRLLAAFARYVVRANAELAILRSEHRLVAETQQRLAEHNQLLRELAVVDALTGLRNRRFFERTLASEVDRTRRYARALSIALIDVDAFKSVNDRSGHPVGDEVLRAVSRHLEGSVRRADLAARYGGDEFALILPETGGAGALQVAERAREAIEQMWVGGLKVTASVGVVTVHADFPGEVEEVVRAADRALYRAKHAGRNRVVAVELSAASREAPGGDDGK